MYVQKASEYSEKNHVSIEIFVCGHYVTIVLN